jgi:uncharacterized protein (TIGR01777 family)
MSSLRVVVTGSSGLIGTALCRSLTEAGHDVVRLVRRAPGAGEARWDPAAGTIDAGALEGADAVVNLAGAGIGDRRWSDDYRQKVHDSRVFSTTLLATTIATASSPPAVLLSGSAVGIYGTSLDATFTESSPTGHDFLAEVCHAWEAAAAPAADAGTRVAFLRTGIVLSPDGGVLPKLMLPVKFFVGGPFGDGRQWQSWISIHDEVRAIVHLLTSELSGPVNLTAPNPASNRDVVRSIGRVLGRPSWLRVPRLPVRVVLGREMADSLLFDGQKVLPQALTDDKFTFADPDLEPALHRLLQR